MSDSFEISSSELLRLSEALAGPLSALAKANGTDLSEEEISSIIKNPESQVNPTFSIVNPAAIVIEIIIRVSSEDGGRPLDIKLRRD